MRAPPWPTSHSIKLTVRVGIGDTTEGDPFLLRSRWRLPSPRCEHTKQHYRDFSRTFYTGPNAPTRHQKELYKVAREQVQHNMAILRPGLSFRDYSQQAWPIPERYLANRYYLSAHGCGMTGEYPYLYHSIDFDQSGYDGVIEPGMTICVESYIGEEHGDEGVKLEQQVLITDGGTKLISTFPFEAALLGAPV